MARNNPYTIGITTEARVADPISDLRSRMAIQERGGGSPGSGSATIVDATTLVKGKVQLAGDIAGSASAVLVKKLTSLGTTAMTDQIVLDTAHGENVNINGGVYVDGVGQRWNIYHGTTGAPNAVQQPTFKVSRTETIASTSSGAGASQHSAILGNNVAASSKAMCVGVTGQGKNSTAGTHAGTTNNLDACGVVGTGSITGSGGGAAIAGYFDAWSTATWATGPPVVCRAIHGIEATASNYTGTDGTIDGTGGPWTVSFFAAPSGRAGGAGMQLYNPFSLKYNVGFHLHSVNGGPASDQSFRDDGTAATSLQINGTHSTAAIGIASGAGNVGIGILAPTAKLDLATPAMTDRVFQDQAHGIHIGSGVAGIRYDIRHGLGSPNQVSAEGATFRISRYENITSNDGDGTSGHKWGALQVWTQAASTSIAQPLGAFFHAHSFSTQTPSSTVNTDAEGVQGKGTIASGGTGRGLGGTFKGQSDSTSGKCTGLEAVVGNNGVAHTIGGGGNGSDSMGIWCYSHGTYKGAVGIQFGRGSQTTGGWDYGIYIGGGVDQGNAIETTSYWDEGDSPWSVRVGGTHTSGAIVIEEGSGYLGVGTTGPLYPVHAIRADTGFIGYFASSASVAARVAIDSVASQQADLSFRDGATTKWQLIKGTTNNFTINDAAAGVAVLTIASGGGFAFGGTAGAGYLQLTEQSSAPGTAATGTARLYAEASGATTVLKFKDDAGVIATLGTGGSGITTATDSAHIDFTVTGSDITGTLFTTATPQFAGLGIGAAAAANTGILISGTNSVAALAVDAAGGRVGIGTTTPASRLNLGYTAAGAESTVAADGITFGDDVELYRNSADILKLRDGFDVNSSSGSTTCLAGAVAGIFLSNAGRIDVTRSLTTEVLRVYGTAADANPRFFLLGSGSMTWQKADGTDLCTVAADSGLTGLKIGAATTERLGFWGTTPAVRASDYTVTTSLTTFTPDRTYDADTVTLAELSTVVSTLISDLQSYGLLGGTVT